MQLEDAGHGRFPEVSWVAQTGSTNADLMLMAKQAPARARVLFADEQTAGRGRRDRSWAMAPGGGLLVSFFVPWSHAEQAHVIPTALGVAAIEAIAMAGREVFLKWPNDVVSADGHKLGGMLSEVVAVDGEFRGVVVGLGCNVSWPDASTPRPAGLEQAVSLDSLGSNAVNRAALARSLVAAFDSELDAMQSRGLGVLHDRYRQRCSTLGRTVRIEQEAGGQASAIEGIATDVSPDGALLVSVDGVQRRIDVGDVAHLRRAPG